MTVADPTTQEYSLTCPCCRRSWVIPEEVRKECLAEMKSWDRRYDRPETILSEILSILSEEVSKGTVRAPLKSQ